MEITKLRQACERRPFHPFDVLLSDASRLRVPHPEFAAVAPEGATAVIWQDGFPVWVDVAAIIAIDFQRQSPRRPKRAR